jgi:hypothetical protein
MKRIPKVKTDYTDWTLEQHIEHLRTDPRYTAEFAKYTPKSVDEFITRYAETKYEGFKERAFYEEEYEEHQTQFLLLADKYIDMILMKKLFNLRCQWQAEQIKLPLIEIGKDFEYWEDHIRSCPFIQPITQEELDTCMAYLREQVDLSDEECDGFPRGWLDYEKFKNQLEFDESEADEADDTPEMAHKREYNSQRLPNFYVFYDERHGTDDLIDLPNIRGQKEKVYHDEYLRLSREEQRKEAAAKAQTTPETPTEPVEYLPSISVFRCNFPDFIDAVEDDETKEVMKYHYHYFPRFDDDSEGDYEYLKKIEGPVSLIAHEDWRFSLKISVLYYKQSKAAEVLSYAYEAYMMEFDEDTPFEQRIAERVARLEFDKEHHAYIIAQYRKKRLLDARESLDGVRNFDF